jgi:hypothetical protein
VGQSTTGLLRVYLSLFPKKRRVLVAGSHLFGGHAPTSLGIILPIIIVKYSDVMAYIYDDEIELVQQSITDIRQCHGSKGSD